MSEPNLATYLNDHLAGSVAALEMLEHLERMHSGTPAAQLAASLQLDILADRQHLEALMARLQINASRPRRAVAWVAGKMTDLKLWLDDPANSGLRQLEILEGLSVGIEGKRLLWRSLSAASAAVPELRGIDYAALTQRAADQRGRIEIARLAAAAEAFGCHAAAEAASSAAL